MSVHIKSGVPVGNHAISEGVEAGQMEVSDKEFVIVFGGLGELWIIADNYQSIEEYLPQQEHCTGDALVFLYFQKIKCFHIRYPMISPPL